jgi:hypothetical protein
MHIRKERHAYDKVEHSDGRSSDTPDPPAHRSLRALVSGGSRNSASKKPTASPRKSRPSSMPRDPAKDSVTQDRPRSPKRRGSKIDFGLTLGNPEGNRGSGRKASSRSSSVSSDDGLMVEVYDHGVITKYSGKEYREKFESKPGSKRRSSSNRKAASTIPRTRSHRHTAGESDSEDIGKLPVEGYSPLSAS